MKQMILPFFKNAVQISYTEKGVTEISFKKSMGQMKKPSDSMAKLIEKQLTKYLKGQTETLELDIDWGNLRGTDFQKRVWKKMIKIPYGKVKTYGEIAQSLQSPGASRAVGTACGKNPVLLVIPCHRVVGANSLGGFSGGGLGIKRQLLDLEGSSY